MFVCDYNRSMCDIWLCALCCSVDCGCVFLAVGVGSVEVRAAAKECTSGKGQGKSFHLGSVLGKSKTTTVTFRIHYECTKT